MLGRGLLVCAIGFAAYAGVAAPASLRRERTTQGAQWSVARPELLDSARRALVAVAVSTGAAAGVLWWALFTRDFSIAYVARSTSRAAQPWYTFSALWSGMSGSLLLWSLILAVYAAVFAARKRPGAEAFVPWAIPVLAATLLFFLGITAGPENPFARSDVVPVDGRGMNPLLQSPGMIIHPPLLYAGLTGLTVPFAVAVSALITRRTGADWIRVVRRWTLVPWLALGTGLVLGGAWAYTELGWGGYWAWDPVENAALLPWLAATAFLHSAVIQERRGMLKVWNVFLITTAADLAIFGTFLTRSGLLSSVHTFAESPIGKWFFVFLAAQTLVGLGLLAWRLPHLRTENRLDGVISREAGFLLNNFVFLAIVFVVLWGTLLPLVTEAVWGRELTVGPPFFNRVVSPMAALLLVLAAVAPVLPWRRGTPRAVRSRLAVPAVWALGAGAVALAVTRRPSFAGVVALAAVVTAASLTEVVRAARARARRLDRSVGAATAELFSRSPRRYGGYVVHVGIAVMVLGFAGSLFRTQTHFVAGPGDDHRFAGYRLVHSSLERFEAPDKLVSRARMDVYRGDRRVAVLYPQLNIHRNWDQPQSEIAIRSTPLEDLYVILAATPEAGSEEVAYRVHRNPLVLWVWLGAVLAAAGGGVAMLAGRRPRPAAAATHRPREEVAPAWTR